MGRIIGEEVERVWEIGEARNGREKARHRARGSSEPGGLREARQGEFVTMHGFGRDDGQGRLIRISDGLGARGWRRGEAMACQLLLSGSRTREATGSLAR